MIKYIGSKRKLIGDIIDTVAPLSGVNTVVDLFSGTSRVGYAMKEHGYQVVANDMNHYAFTIATCHVQADKDEVMDDVQRILNELNKIDVGYAGYFTETFCEKSRFIQPFNGMRIDRMRDEVEAMALTDEVKACVVTSLIEAADSVDSTTTGLQMAYLKTWAKRSCNPLCLRMPAMLSQPAGGKCKAMMGDALVNACDIKADLFYLDPPYNQHSYLGNYHMWETLSRWDKPEVYGIACKRVDVREKKSLFNTKNGCLKAMTELLGNIESPYVLVSFNNEGFIHRDEMLDILSHHGETTIKEIENARYVGHAIGVFSPSGEKVGTAGPATNKEYLFLLKKA